MMKSLLLLVRLTYILEILFSLLLIEEEMSSEKSQNFDALLMNLKQSSSHSFSISIVALLLLFLLQFPRHGVVKEVYTKSFL